MDFIEILGFIGGILVIGLLVAFYKFAHLDNGIGRYLRLNWNIAMAIMSIIPYIGFVFEKLKIDDPDNSNIEP